MAKNNKQRGQFRVSFAEINIIFASDGLVLALPSDLKSATKISVAGRQLAEFCHIYLVLRRPGLKFVPETIIQDERVRGKISLTKNGCEQVADFTVPRSGSRLHWDVSGFPHRLIESEPVFPSYKESLPAYVVPTLGRVAHTSAHEAEVLYIGQSFGDGHRAALDRLVEHSTLQRVLADVNYHTPDQEVLLMLVEYAPPKLFLLIPPESTYPKEYTVDDAEAQRAINERMKQTSRAAKHPTIPLYNQISIIEAALINYFSPPYNEKFVQQKPRSSHQHLVECYNEDFSALTVEINTEDLQIALYSASKSPGLHHLARFDLHDTKRRKSFFRLAAFDSEVGMIESGPIVPPQPLKNGRFAILGFGW